MNPIQEYNYKRLIAHPIIGKYIKRLGAQSEKITTFPLMIGYGKMGEVLGDNPYSKLMYYDILSKLTSPSSRYRPLYGENKPFAYLKGVLVVNCPNWKNELLTLSTLPVPIFLNISRPGTTMVSPTHKFLGLNFLTKPTLRLNDKYVLTPEEWMLTVIHEQVGGHATEDLIKAIVGEKKLLKPFEQFAALIPTPYIHLNSVHPEEVRAVMKEYLLAKYMQYLTKYHIPIEMAAKEYNPYLLRRLNNYVLSTINDMQPSDIKMDLIANTSSGYVEDYLKVFDLHGDEAKNLVKLILTYAPAFLIGGSALSAKNDLLPLDLTLPDVNVNPYTQTYKLGGHIKKRICKKH